jgi:DUF971 family protein
VLLRQLLLAFSVTLPADEPHIQAIYVCMTLACYGLFCASYLPWNSDLLNIADLVQCFGLLTFIVVSTCIMDPSNKLISYQTIMCSVVGSMIATQAYVIFMAIMQRLRNGKHTQLEQAYLTSGPPENLSRIWLDLCVACADIPAKELHELVARMTVYDWRILRDAVGAWHALAPHEFPASKSMQKRLIGLEHSVVRRGRQSTQEVVKAARSSRSSLYSVSSDGQNDHPSTAGVFENGHDLELSQWKYTSETDLEQHNVHASFAEELATV